MIHVLFIDNIIDNFVSQFNLFLFLFVTVRLNAKDGLKEIKISSRISLRILAGHCYDLPYLLRPMSSGRDHRIHGMPMSCQEWGPWKG